MTATQDILTLVRPIDIILPVLPRRIQRHVVGVLRRGFALVRDEAGRTVRSVAGLAPGQGLDVELADGNVAAEVRTTQAKQPVAAHLAERNTSAPPRAASKPKKPPEGQGSLFE